MEIKDCVVLLAGLGTRCYPFAYSVPKCMIPVGTKPVIEYIVDEAKLSEIENIYFVLPKFMDTKVVLKHFENQKRLLEILTKKQSVLSRNKAKEISKNKSHLFKISKWKRWCYIGLSKIFERQIFCRCQW